MHGKERWIMSDSGNEQKQKLNKTMANSRYVNSIKADKYQLYLEDLDPFVDFVLDTGEIGKLTERIQEIK